MPSTNQYWKKYDFLYKKHWKRTIYQRLKKQCSRLKEPYLKHDPRGRKPKFTLQEYAAYLAIQKIFRHKYRTMELEADLYLPKKADHSTFARNYDKITEEFLELLLSSFVNRDVSYWIADSTLYEHENTHENNILRIA